MLQYRERKRLGHPSQGGFVALKAEPFFDGLDWNRLERRELMVPWIVIHIPLCYFVTLS